MKRLLLSILVVLLCTMPMSAGENNKIYYTSSDGQIVVPSNADAFGGLTIVSNEYLHGQGCITFSDDVTSIGERAFNECYSLTNVTIPNSVTSIGKEAFAYCRGLKSLTIPGNVASIGRFAFQDCQVDFIQVSPDNVYYDSRENCNAIIETTTNTFVLGCKNSFIPNGITKIEDNAFWRCYDLTSITIPNSVLSIGSLAFAYCRDLKSINIPSRVTSFHTLVLIGCESLESITVDVNNPKYDSRVNCNAVIETETNSLISGCKNTVIPYGITSIAVSAFHQCYGLTSIRIPASVTNIYGDVFTYCTQLNDVYVEWDTPLAISADVFRGVNLSNLSLHVPVGKVQAYCDADVWKDFGSKGETQDNNKLFYTSTYGTVIEPNDPNAFGDVHIVSNTYENGQGCITFSGDMTTIGNAAFYSKGNLSYVTIPNSVTSIVRGAFMNCISLRHLLIPSSISSIEPEAFVGCGLETIAVDQNNQYYDSRENCNAIIDKATNTLVTGCKNSVIPSSVTSIGSYAFYRCRSLTSITIPGTIKQIGDYAFDECYNLGSVTLQDGVTSIGYMAFGDCQSLTGISIPKTVTEISNGNLFSRSNNLETITVDPENHVYDSRDNCNAIIETATNTLISSCKNTVIPESVERLAFGAFSQCSGLKSITIPSSVNSFENQVFFYCKDLTDIYVSWNTPLAIPVEDVVFDGVNTGTVTLHVPAGTADAYRAADVWKEFNIVENASPSEDTDISGIDNVMYFINQRVSAGSRITLPVCMKNSAKVTAFSFELTLPEGVTVAKDANGKNMISLDASRKYETHSLSSNTSVRIKSKR